MYVWRMRLVASPLFAALVPYGGYSFYGSGLHRLRACDSELTQAMIESCAVDSESSRGARRPAYDPFCVGQHAKNMFTLDRLERRRAIRVVR